MRLYTVKGWHYLDIWIDGARHRRSLGTKDPREAIVKAAEVLELARIEVAAVPVVRLEDATALVIALLKNKSTQKAYRCSEKRLIEHFGADCDLAMLDADAIDRYIDMRTLRGISSHTIHKELVMLRQAWKKSFPRQSFPFGTFSADYEPRKRFLTAQEASKLIAVASPRARTWIMLGLYAGAEPAAIRRTTWAEVDVDAQQLHLRGTKAQTRDRRVPICPALADYLAGLDSSAPLVGGWANPYRDLAKWCTKAGIASVCRMDFRRTFGSWLKQAGVDSKRVADLMGHVNSQMVDAVYGQLNAAAYREAIDVLKPLPLVSIA